MATWLLTKPSARVKMYNVDQTCLQFAKGKKKVYQNSAGLVVANKQDTKTYSFLVSPQCLHSVTSCTDLVLNGGLKEVKKRHLSKFNK